MKNAIDLGAFIQSAVNQNVDMTIPIVKVEPQPPINPVQEPLVQAAEVKRDELYNKPLTPKEQTEATGIMHQKNRGTFVVEPDVQLWMRIVGELAQSDEPIEYNQLAIRIGASPQSVNSTLSWLTLRKITCRPFRGQYSLRDDYLRAIKLMHEYSDEKWLTLIKYLSNLGVDTDIQESAAEPIIKPKALPNVSEAEAMMAGWLEDAKTRLIVLEVEYQRLTDELQRNKSEQEKVKALIAKLDLVNGL